MAKKVKKTDKKKEKSLRLTIQDFSEIQRKYPDSIEVLNYANHYKSKNIAYIKLTELHNQQKKLGKDIVPDVLIEEMTINWGDDHFRRKIQDKNKAFSSKKEVPCVEDSFSNLEEMNEAAILTAKNEKSNADLTDNQTHKPLEDIIPQQEISTEEDKIPEKTEWRGIYATTIGRSHLHSHPQVPCQDAAKAISKPRAGIFVADGAGSARLSHFGSKAVVEGLGEFTHSIESIHQNILDREQILNCNESNEGKEYAYKFIKYAIERLRELSEQKECRVDDLKCTLLMTVLGKHYLFWLKVGDGFIVVEKDNKLELLGSVGKGEFANQTTFLSERLKDEAIYYGFLPVQNVTGIAAFTDGAAETLVSMDGSRIAGALSHFFAQTRGGDFDNDSLLGFLEDEKVWASPKGFDDRGLALLAQLQ
ncbi:MAG: protein phosphatase 2C domain-containing protein [Brasilonema octagenarum HA4186-MV1]|nr:protein phosphatase 2C domain-containing protein [Brasilonema octagenarum HA4186-MV1]